MTARESLYLGVDFGTSGCRAVVISTDGTLQAEARTPIPAAPRDGARHEQDPADWWQAFEAVVAALREQIDTTRITALAIDGTSATLLLTDETGTPLGPALLYDDSRARDEAASIAHVAPADCAARGATSSLAKLMHLWHQPAYRGARHALHQADWIAGRLLKRYTHSDENNCLKLGYDPVRRAWPDWIAALDIDARLFPWPTPPGQIIGLVDASMAQQFGFAPDMKIAAGTTDSTAAFLATGAREVGDAVTALGSTLVLKVLAGQPVFAPVFGIYSHRLGERWLVGGASNSGGAVLAQHFTPAQLAGLSARIDPDQPCTLDYYPLPATGERFPIADTDLAPRLTPRPADDAAFLHGLLDGMARIEQAGYAKLAELGAPYPRNVRSTGGGAINTTWTALRAKRLGVPMLASTHTEACYGAALLARHHHLAAY